MKIFACITALLLVAGCSYPQSSASTVDTRPLLSIANAPADAQVAVDGVQMGDAAQYAPDKKQITLDHGTHHVVVTASGKVLFDNAVYLGDGTNRTINLPN